MSPPPFNNNFLTASQVLSQVNASLQSWVSRSAVSEAGLGSLAPEIEPHLPALDFLLPQQASLLRRLMDGESLGPDSIVQLAASIAEASEIHTRLDEVPNGNETGRRARVTSRYPTTPPVPVRVASVPAPASVSSAPPALGDASSSINLARMTGGLLSSLGVLFDEWYEKEGQRVTGRGEITNAGILFTDFKGFSTKTKGVPPDQVRQRLNFYFHFLSLVVAQLGGRVDKYVGDAIMAYVVGDHAKNAFKAVEIGFTLQQLMNLMNEFLIQRALDSRAMKEKLAELGKSVEDLDVDEKRRLVEEVDPLIFEMRVGVHTGSVIHGEIGGPGKIELTIIGDAVNTANRMESVATPGSVAISDAVRADLGDEFELIDRGDVSAKGIGSVHVYEIAGRNHEKTGLRILRSIHTTVQGREEEVAYLEREFLHSATQSQSRLVLIEAEAGAGKSTVADSFLMRLKEIDPSVADGFELILGRGNFRPEISPFEILAEAVRRRAGLRPGLAKAERESKIRLLAAEADAHSEQERESFAYLLGLFLDEALDGPPENILNLQKNPSEFRERTEDMLIRLFAGLSRNRPLVFVFDDMQWVDDSSLRVIHRALSDLQRSPVMMVGLTRPFDRDAAQGKIPWFDGPFTATALELRTLSEENLEKIVRQVLGEDVSRADIDAILSRSAGSPLFAQEIAAAVKSGIPISQVPRSIQELFQAQLRDLETGPFELLKAAALIGREFSEDDLIGVGVSQHQAFLAELVEGNFVVPREGVPGGYLFRHDLMSETVRGMMEEGEKKRLHLALACHLARSANPEDALIASHFQKGDDFESAAKHYLLAAKDAAQKGTYAESASFSQIAYKETRDAERKVSALLDWSDALYYSGRYKEQLVLFPQFETALASLGSTDRETSARIRIHRAQALQNNNRHEDAEAELNLALALYGSEESGPFKCRVLNLLGNIHSQNKHDHAAAEAYYRTALATAQSLGELYYTGMSWVNLSHIRLTQGDYSGGLTAALSGIEAFERAGDVKGQLFAINNAGSALVSIGDYQEAMRIYERGISLSRSKMNNFLLLSLLPSFAQPAWKSGARTKALKAIEEVISMYQGDHSAYSFMRGVAHYCHSIFSAEMGDFQEALSQANETLAVAKQTNDRSRNIEAMAYMAMARAHMVAGDAASALAASSQAMAILNEVESIQDYDLAILATHIDVLLKNKADQEAMIVANRAKKTLDQRAAAIADEKRKASFLMGVEENRTIEHFWRAFQDRA